MANDIVSQDEWLAARQLLLAKEKAASKAREELTAARAQMPWVEVENDYSFNGPSGKLNFIDLFDGRSQLIVSHFMFAPEWDAGCPSCSFWADGYEGQVEHLHARDVSFVAVSRAPIDKLLAYATRMGWSFPWVSADGDAFNRDFGVYFSEAERDADAKNYNFGTIKFGGSDAPGISVFIRQGDRVFRTYSCYARGLEPLNVTYHLLDLVPKGRDEGGLDFTMAWLKRRDQY